MLHKDLQARRLVGGQADNARSTWIEHLPVRAAACQDMRQHASEQGPRATAGRVMGHSRASARPASSQCWLWQYPCQDMRQVMSYTRATCERYRNSSPEDLFAGSSSVGPLRQKPAPSEDSFSGDRFDGGPLRQRFASLGNAGLSAKMTRHPEELWMRVAPAVCSWATGKVPSSWFDAIGAGVPVRSRPWWSCGRSVSRIPLLRGASGLTVARERNGLPKYPCGQSKPPHAPLQYCQPPMKYLWAALPVLST